jgi:hypothetical protein
MEGIRGKEREEERNPVGKFKSSSGTLWRI